MRCNQICKWNSNVGCIKPWGVPCILENRSPTGKKATNADRIRSMSDEEFAKILGAKCICPPIGKCVMTIDECDACWLKWLQQPTETPIRDAHTHDTTEANN